MSDLPKRVPGAHLLAQVEPPPEGWFGAPDIWPRDDLDGPVTTSVFEHYLDGHQFSENSGAEMLLHRVLTGLHRLGQT
jgi:hypothetical protein